MSDETTNAAGQPREYSAAEIDEMRKAEIEEYKKENAWLEQRVKNATLQADLEVQETRRVMAVAQRYQIVGPRQPEKSAEPKETPSGTPETPVSETPQETSIPEKQSETVPSAEPSAEKPARTLKSTTPAE